MVFALLHDDVERSNTVPTMVMKTVRLSELRTNPKVNRDIDQNWVDRLVKNWHAEAVGVPIVASQNGHYIILDGQHRVEALRQMHIEDRRLQVRVIEGLNISEMARLFVELNEDRGIPAYTKFEKRVTAGDPDASAIAGIVGRVGLILRNEPRDRNVGAVVALERVYRFDGTGSILEMALITTLGALGEGSENFNGNIIQGIGQFYRRFPTADQARLVTVLKKNGGGGYGLLGKGKSLREINGGSLAANITEVLIRLYNRGLKNKLDG